MSTKKRPGIRKIPVLWLKISRFSERLYLGALCLEFFQQLFITLALNDTVELAAVIGDQAHPVDHREMNAYSTSGVVGGFLVSYLMMAKSTRLFLDQAASSCPGSTGFSLP